ncbi:MAG: hypothetical protein OXD01_00995 [Gammaproteobacteria bacterium]|nr:hypothetical protein [Gammaproteobacteria bacterium]
MRIILLGEVIAFDTCRLVRRLMETGFTWAQTEEALLDGRNRLLNGSLVYRQDC